MVKILAIAADYQHLRNYCREKDIPLNKFVHATDPKKMRGLGRGYNYIVISEPYDYGTWYEMQEEFRYRDANRLPLDINEWPLDMFL